MGERGEASSNKEAINLLNLVRAHDMISEAQKAGCLLWVYNVRVRKMNDLSGKTGAGRWCQGSVTTDIAVHLYSDMTKQARD